MEKVKVLVEVDGTQFGVEALMDIETASAGVSYDPWSVRLEAVRVCMGGHAIGPNIVHALSDGVYAEMVMRVGMEAAQKRELEIFVAETTGRT